MQRRARGYSLLMVMMMMALLGVAVGGLFAVILRGGVTSGALLDRRTTFYGCDGMGRQLASLGQAFLSRNTREDVPESLMERDLRQALPLITPPGFTARAADLVIPERALPDPAPIEVITTGPFSGLEVKLQVIDMRFQATRTGSGAVCRTEQTLSLGRIALFQFFVFADLPLLDIVPPGNDPLFLRGRIHTNGRTCIGGHIAPPSFIGGPRGPFTVRLDTNVTAVDRILRGTNEGCGLGGDDVGVMGKRARGPAAPPPEPDRLLDVELLSPFTANTDSGCRETECTGGWRSFALNTYAGRMQDRDHEVQELTLPVDPPEMHSQRGWAANGPRFTQKMHAGPSRPNTRFLVEPELTNDKDGFARNKMSFKAQIRIIDGVWYVKDPGADNSAAADADDGPWPGIPIWSDHPGEFTVGLPAMGKEGVEGKLEIPVGQSDIRSRLDVSTDARLLGAQWQKRAALRASPTPRRFSYYAFVDRTQSAAANTLLSPRGMGLQFGRLGDVDPPAVISYGAITPVFLGGASGSFFGSGRFGTSGGAPTSGDQPYWLPGVRMTDERFDANERASYTPRNRDVGFCGGRSDQFAINPIANNIMMPAVPQPLTRVDSDDNSFFAASSYPAAGEPLPGDGTRLERASGSDGWIGGRICADDADETSFRKRMRLALLESTRSGFADTNNQNNSGRLNAAAKNAVLPLNFNMHAFQEALADKTPGELGSFFCPGCLWEKFDGTIYVSNTWKGSMLGAETFPDGQAAPPTNPVFDDSGDASLSQPKATKEDLSTTGPLPYPLCAADSDEDGVALAQVVGHRFLEADEVNVQQRSDTPTSPLDTAFNMPFQRQDPDMTRNTAFRRRFPKHTPASPSPAEAQTTQAPPVDVATTTLTGSFRIPECKNYSLVNGRLAAVRPTSVRLINARTINFNASKCGPERNKPCLPQLSGRAEGLLDAGVNFVTNVPLYVVGDVNQSSEIDDVQSGKKATDWVPVMLGGDSVTTLSNGWSDEFSRWGVETDERDLNITSLVNRPAVTTRYNMLLLTGINGAGVYNGREIVPVGSGGGLPSAMRLMEDWSGQRHIFRGAMVLGWMPVFTQWIVGQPGTKTFKPPALRDWQFDRHLNATINQPPDSPVFDVTALRSWRRE